jgi:hypothetical protein
MSSIRHIYKLSDAVRPVVHLIRRYVKHNAWKLRISGCVRTCISLFGNAAEGFVLFPVAKNYKGRF